MDRSKLIERLTATFLGELGEHVRTINDDLLALEKDPDGAGRADRFKSLFRAAHSLKGASRSVGAGPIEEACHRLETILERARDGVLATGPELFALIFATADAIEEAGMRLREQHDLRGSPLAALMARLDAAVEGTLTPPVRSPAAPPAPPREEPPPPEAGPAAPPARPAREIRPPSVPIPAPPIPGEPEKLAGVVTFVRIPAEKLDTMLSRSGELLVARRRVESRAQELVALRDAVARGLGEWGRASKPFRRLLARPDESLAAGSLPRRALEAFMRAGETLGQLEKDLDAFAARSAGDRRALARAAGMLDEEVRRVRMLPFAEACQGLERVVRDIAGEAGKEVELVVEGGDVELDRSVLEWLKDPLLHLVRNAVDHGIETPGRRRSAGKRERARVTVSASLRGSQVEVVVSDDGRGLDREALREAALRRGIPEPADDRDLADLIFLPGFSTAPIITNISGRGVGLDVVKSRIEALHGTIVLASEPGTGTRFTLAVPLTLTTLRALLVRAGGEVFALASANVETLLRVGVGDCRPVEGRPFLVLGGAPVPVSGLAEVLGIAVADTGAGAGAVAAKRPALIVVSGDRRAAFVVDELIAELEILVKGLGPRIRRVRKISGGTILPSGRVALVLNAAHLVRGGQGRAPRATSSRPQAPAEASRKRLLVVDDSVTTRTLEKSILEAAGYEVLTAVDGEAGWRLLQEQGADLLISDIEMPRMDGFALTETVRASPRFVGLPIVLFSSRASEQDQARGIAVGADAYIIKGAFDQKDLLETVAQLL